MGFLPDCIIFPPVFLRYTVSIDWKITPASGCDLALYWEEGKKSLNGRELVCWLWCRMLAKWPLGGGLVMCLVVSLVGIVLCMHSRDGLRLRYEIFLHAGVIWPVLSWNHCCIIYMYIFFYCFLLYWLCCKVVLSCFRYFEVIFIAWKMTCQVQSP